MELVDRYLQVIRRCLPKAQQDDIVAELHDTLMSRIEEREQQLQRTLNERELADEIKSFGHPIEVASRYFPQQYLIGPNVFPFWWFVVRIGLIGLMLMYAIIAVVAALQGGHVTKAITQAAYAYVGIASFWLTAITLLFWGLDKLQIKLDLLKNWRPENLPKLKDIRVEDEKFLSIKRSDTVFQILFGIAFLLFWTGTLSFPAAFWHHNEPLHFSLAAVWQNYSVAIIVLAAIDLVLAMYNLILPYWTRPRLLINMACSAASIVLIVLITQADVLLLWQGEAATTGERIYQNSNTGLRYVLYIIAAVEAGTLFSDMRRWFKCK